jgi:anti-sigma factor RsiW
VVVIEGNDVQCDHVSDCLSAYVDGELPAELIGEVESHLSSCTKCARAVATMKRLGDLLAAVGVPDMPGTIAELAMARARPQWPGVQRAGWASWRKRWVFNPLRMAAACLAGITVGVVMSRQLWESPSDTANVAGETPRIDGAGDTLERSSLVFLGAEEDSAKQLVAAMIPAYEQGD